MIVVPSCSASRRGSRPIRAATCSCTGRCSQPGHRCDCRRGRLRRTPGRHPRPRRRRGSWSWHRSLLPSRSRSTVGFSVTIGRRSRLRPPAKACVVVTPAYQHGALLHYRDDLELAPPGGVTATELGIVSRVGPNRSGEARAATGLRSRRRSAAPQHWTIRRYRSPVAVEVRPGPSSREKQPSGEISRCSAERVPAELKGLTAGSYRDQASVGHPESTNAWKSSIAPVEIASVPATAARDAS